MDKSTISMAIFANFFLFTRGSPMDFWGFSICFSHHFQTSFAWFSMGFPNGFPWGFPSFSDKFYMVFHGFSQWFSMDLPIIFRQVLHGFPWVFPPIIFRQVLHGCPWFSQWFSMDFPMTSATWKCYIFAQRLQNLHIKVRQLHLDIAPNYGTRRRREDFWEPGDGWIMMDIHHIML